MTAVERLLTTAYVDDRAPDEHVSVRARHEAVLTDGRRLLLLDDRGWGSTQRWSAASAEDVEETARVVVGPDEPPEGRTWEQEQTGHWAHLARILEEHGVAVDARDLRRLPHDVVLTERLLALLGGEPASS
ncbi:hypothetical protein [Pseudonocardia hierapolitana]|nr:hypothetical protein [Pseudonocardia hierapolitana]